jgi:hypothetical protein
MTAMSCMALGFELYMVDKRLKKILKRIDPYKIQNSCNESFDAKFLNPINQNLNYTFS